MYPASCPSHSHTHVNRVTCTNPPTPRPRHPYTLLLSISHSLYRSASQCVFAPPILWTTVLIAFAMWAESAITPTLTTLLHALSLCVYGVLSVVSPSRVMGRGSCTVRCCSSWSGRCSRHTLGAVGVLNLSRVSIPRHVVCHRHVSSGGCVSGHLCCANGGSCFDDVGCV